MKILIRLIVTVFIIIALLLVLAWPAGSGDGGQESSREGLPFPREKALFEKLRVMEAWAMTKGSPEVKIGVIETGFDFYHPGLRDNLNPGYFAPGGYHLDISDSVARRGCDDIGEAGTDLRTGHGRVNFGKTLTLAKSWKE